MKLVIEELVEGVGQLTQKITTGDHPIVLGAIRPHIFLAGPPTGSVDMQVQNSAGNTTLAQSEYIPFSSITTAAYYHGVVRFYIKMVLAAATTYQIALRVSGGYTYTEAAYMGWCKNFENRLYASTYTPYGYWDSPFEMELWSYKNVVKGNYT